MNLTPTPLRKSIRKTIAQSLILLLFSFSFSQIFAAVDPAGGEKLFKANCATCHRIDSKLVGPALKDVDKRRSEEWIIKWVHNNGALRNSGDKDAKAIFDEYNKVEMPAFASMSDDDVRSIIAYIQKAGATPPPTPNQPGGGGTENAAGGSTDEGTSPSLWIVFGALIIVAFILHRVNKALRHMVAQKHGEEIEEQHPFFRRRSTIVSGVLILLIAGGWMAYDGAASLGRSHLYQPDQPIFFSHKVHAGINQINCLYCHANAEKGRAATIPTVSICLNCHRAITEYKGEQLATAEGQKVDGTAEIQKIYAYAGMSSASEHVNLEKATPLKWVKIHNLPDYVTFNHSQHVVVGKVECQSCHGPIQKMDQVYQANNLSMSFCVNCHRATPVKFEENNYYSMYTKLHEDLKSGKIKQVTEADMGGEDCQRCHY